MAKVYPERVVVPDYARQIATVLKGRGGKTYVVGGYVRDMLLGMKPKDIDFEVHGMTPEDIQSALEAQGYKVNAVGKSFGVLKVRVGKEDLDIAVPRTDSTGRKPVVEFLRNATPEAAAKRRDFAFNALMYDVLGGQVVDPYGGVEDLKKDLVRATSEESFADDPLRVMRAAQFASRFGFTVEPRTRELAKTVDVMSMSAERIREELEKAMVKSQRPSVFFHELDEMGQLDRVFPEIAALKGVPQSTENHPEGDVYVHTMQALDRSAGQDRKVMLGILLHDTGKKTKTVVDEQGRIRAIGHEVDSEQFGKQFLRRLKFDTDTERDVRAIVRHHMRPHAMVHADALKLKHVNRALVDIAGSPQKLMQAPEVAHRRFQMAVQMAKIDSGRPAQYEELERALPPLSHYQVKIPSADIVAKFPPEQRSKAIGERYVQEINKVGK